MTKGVKVKLWENEKDVLRGTDLHNVEFEWWCGGRVYCSIYVVAVFLVVTVFFGGVAQIIVNLIEYTALAFLHKYFTSKENVNLPNLNRIV